MHSLNLGIYLIIIAEGILMLARHRPHIPLEESIRVDYSRFRNWCSQTGVSCSQRCWTPKVLHLTGQAENYPWLKAKAYNARVILAWLAAPFLKKFLFQYNPLFTAYGLIVLLFSSKN